MSSVASSANLTIGFAGGKWLHAEWVGFHVTNYAAKHNAWCRAFRRFGNCNYMGGHTSSMYIDIHPHAVNVKRYGTPSIPFTLGRWGYNSGRAYNGLIGNFRVAHVPASLILQEGIEIQRNFTGKYARVCIGRYYCTPILRNWQNKGFLPIVREVARRHYSIAGQRIAWLKWNGRVIEN